MAEPAALEQPVPFRVLLDEAVRGARRHFLTILPPVAVPVALGQVALVVVQNRAMGSWFSGAEPEPGALFGGLLSLGCIAVLFGAFSGVAYSAMGAAAVDAAAGRPVSMAGSWRFVLRPRVLLTLLSIGLAITAGMLLCLLPGIWLLLLLGLAVPVMVEEGAVLGDAWRRSIRLARYNPQRRLASSPMTKIFVFLVVGYVLSFAASMLVQMPFVLVQQALIFREVIGGADPGTLYASRWLWLQVPSALFGSIAQSAVGLYLSFGMALLYFDVRRRREGLDLEAAVDQLLGGAGGEPMVPRGAGPLGLPGEGA